MSFASGSRRPGDDANASSPPWWASWALLGLLGVWGTNFLFMKMALAVVPPLEVAWLRTIFGALPITAFALARGSLTKTDWRFAHHFAVMALLANVGPYVFFVIGTAPAVGCRRGHQWGHPVRYRRDRCDRASR